MLNKNIFGEVPEVVDNAVRNTLASLEEHTDFRNIESLKSNKNSRVRKRNTIRISWAAVCLICFLVSGITVSAMGFLNLYRQRMEEMGTELMDQYYEDALAGETTEQNRSYTAEERMRYEELNEKYERNGLFPKSQISYVQNAEEYEGKGVALNQENRTLFLPEESLTDEEILEIIDYHHKLTYSIYEKNEERIRNGSNWESRLAEMDDQAVDEVYLAMFTGEGETSGAYCRNLTENENVRYQELNEKYEKENLYTVSEPSVIRSSEEYAGTGVAICSKNSTFYFPEEELTDEELLQIIDFEHKASYCIDKIYQQVQMGLREDFPHY